jgi:HlyD family secretion protein
LLLVLAGFVLGGSSVYLASFSARSQPPVLSTSGIPVKSRITALGRLAPEGGVIAVFGPLGDRLETVDVKQGAGVESDAPLAQLVSHRDRELELSLATARVKEATEQRAAIDNAGKSKIAESDAEIRQLRSGRENDLLAQDAQIRVLESQVQQARDNLARLKSLQRAAVSAQELEQSELALRKAEGDLATARAQRNKTATAYQTNQEVAQAKRAAALAQIEESRKRIPVDSLQNECKLAERRFAETIIKAPVKGQILKVVGHKGQATGNEPILYLGDTRNIVVVSEVYETDVQQLDAWMNKVRKEGKGKVTATVRSSALPIEALSGELQDLGQIARLVGKNQLFGRGRSEVDRRVVEVRVKLNLDEEAAKRVGDYTGLEVNVEFEFRSQP